LKEENHNLKAQIRKLGDAKRENLLLKEKVKTLERNLQNPQEYNEQKILDLKNENNLLRNNLRESNVDVETTQIHEEYKQYK